jgi:hypothetical protein
VQTSVLKEAWGLAGFALVRPNHCVGPPTGGPPDPGLQGVALHWFVQYVWGRFSPHLFLYMFLFNKQKT